MEAPQLLLSPGFRSGVSPVSRPSAGASPRVGVVGANPPGFQRSPSPPVARGRSGPGQSFCVTSQSCGEGAADRNFFRAVRNVGRSLSRVRPLPNDGQSQPRYVQGHSPHRESVLAKASLAAPLLRGVALVLELQPVAGSVGDVRGPICPGCSGYGTHSSGEGNTPLNRHPLGRHPVRPESDPVTPCTIRASISRVTHVCCVNLS